MVDTIDILAIQKEMVGSTSLDCEDILKKLQGIPVDIFSDYLNVLDANVEDILKRRSMVAARDNPTTFRHLFEKLNPLQVSRVSDIAMHLSSRDPNDKIEELIYASFDMVIPTPESISKAEKLIIDLRAFSSVYLEKALTCVEVIRDFRMMEDIFVTLNMGIQWEKIVLDRLSALPEDNLNRLCAIVSGALSNNQQ